MIPLRTCQPQPGKPIQSILAIVRSVAATVVSMLFFGWLLAVAAGIEIVQFIMVGRWAGELVHVLPEYGRIKQSLFGPRSLMIC